jgi:glycosyltransferase involved in cell wall biosynthesis
MILFDCVYVNNGGGKILLDVLVKNVNQLGLDVQFLFDDRNCSSFNHENFVNPPLYIKAGERTRKNYYKFHYTKYTKILAFGNVPPPIKLNIPVYTYLHNVLYLEKNKHINLFKFLKITLKATYINNIKKNTDYWIVQTNVVKNKLCWKWNLNKDKILIIPFYQDIIDSSKIIINLDIKKTKKNIIYIYISNGESYKNHKRLFEAFEKFSMGKDNIILKVTISNDYPDLISEIDKYKKRGVSIFNLGLINKDELKYIYSNADFVLFPSFFESFGLGLIEAAQYNLPVIASNYDYVNEIILPSKVFDPLSIISISNALEYSYNNSLKPAQLIVENKIHDLLEIFNN